MKQYEEGTPILPDELHIEISANGPYLVFGNVPIKQQFIMLNDEGNSWTWQEASHDFNTRTEPVALCRCGRTANAPYCDGSHLKADWDPTLTASHRPPLSEAEQIDGPTLVLTDSEKYCAFARFCDAKGRIWNLTEESDDHQKREWAIRTASLCPAGRLKEWDKRTGKPLEPNLKPAIGLIEDPALGVSGGIWVMGGIPVAGYQVRNRATLCRCGESMNKPFCDGTHATAKWHDKIK